MKTFLKYSGIIAVVVAIVGFILMMATPAFAYFPNNGDPLYLTSTEALFGADTFLVVKTGHTNAVWSAVLAWILAMVGMLALICGIILPLIKKEKFAGILNFVALFALVIAGVFIFISQPCTWTPALENAEAQAVNKDYVLNATWIIAAILYIAAGALAILPAAMNLFGGKKK